MRPEDRARSYPNRIRITRISVTAAHSPFAPPSVDASLYKVHDWRNKWTFAGQNAEICACIAAATPLPVDPICRKLTAD
jgi:hypothetical protein